MYVGHVLPSSGKGRNAPIIPAGSEMWDASYMTTEPIPTPLQEILLRTISMSGKTREHFDTLYRTKMGKTGKPIYDIMRGVSKRPQPDTLRAIAQVMGLESEKLVRIVYGQNLTVAAPEPDQPIARVADAGDTVEIVKLDLAFSMGAGADVDDYVEEERVAFDLGYVRSFTRSAPDMLRIAKGVGDSMHPTLNSADLVWIDTTQRTLNQADRIWAVSINGAAAIKRLRPVSEGRILVVSDNPSVENYEVDSNDLRIGGRVIRFARDL
jgi:SOS-response transcriptional repressor LexA